MDATQLVKSLLKAAGTVMIVIVSLLFLWRIADIVLLIFVALLVGLLLSSMTQKLSTVTRFPRNVSLMLVILLFCALLTGVAFWIGPGLIAQVEGLTESLGVAVNMLATWLSSTPTGLWLLAQTPLPPEVLSDLDIVDAASPQPETLRPPVAGLRASSQGLLSTFVSFASSLFGFVPAVFEVFTGVLFVVVMGIFLAANPGLYQRGFLRLFPKSARARTQDVLKALGQTLQGWLLAQLVSMLVIGVVVGLGLWWLGMPFVLSLALIAFSLEFIPTVGPFLSAAPAVLIAFTQSPMLALWVILFYLAVQALEGNVLMPLIQQRVVHLPPALSLLSILIMGSIFGILGLLVATPILAVILVLVKMLYLEDAMGQKVQL